MDESPEAIEYILLFYFFSFTQETLLIKSLSSFADHNHYQKDCSARNKPSQLAENPQRVLHQAQRLSCSSSQLCCKGVTHTKTHTFFKCQHQSPSLSTPSGVTRCMPRKGKNKERKGKVSTLPRATRNTVDPNTNQILAEIAEMTARQATILAKIESVQAAAEAGQARMTEEALHFCQGKKAVSIPAPPKSTTDHRGCSASKQRCDNTNTTTPPPVVGFN